MDMLEILKPYIDDPTCNIIFTKTQVEVYWPKQPDKAHIIIDK